MSDFIGWPPRERIPRLGLCRRSGFSCGISGGDPAATCCCALQLPSVFEFAIVTKFVCNRWLRCSVRTSRSEDRTLRSLRHHTVVETRCIRKGCSAAGALATIKCLRRLEAAMRAAASGGLGFQLPGRNTRMQETSLLHRTSTILRRERRLRKRRSGNHDGEGRQRGARVVENSRTSQKAVGPSPLPGRWPSTLHGQSLASKRWFPPWTESTWNRPERVRFS
jgi:hypothetical protein